MENEKTYLVKSDFDILTIENNIMEEQSIEKFYVFADTEDDIEYMKKNEVYFKDNVEISSEKYNDVVQYCEENMYSSYGSGEKTRYLIKMEGKIYNLDIYHRSIEGLTLLKTDEEYLPDRLKEIIVRDVSDEPIFKQMTS